MCVVLAQTKTTDRLGDKADAMTAFLVDTSLPGVSIHQKHQTIGHRSVYQSNVSFKDVRITEGKHNQLTPQYLCFHSN